jgi:hypothetical protein
MLVVDRLLRTRLEERELARLVGRIDRGADTTFRRG